MINKLFFSHRRYEYAPSGRIHQRVTAFFCFLFLSAAAYADGTRLLRQPSISDSHIAFVYAGDIWIAGLDKPLARRITSTAAIESDPHLSPDGKTIAFTSDRSGSKSVYTVPIEGGTPRRLSWHPSPALVRGWTPDGTQVLYASERQTAPVAYSRLWTVPAEGGAPSLLSHQWGFNGSYSPNGSKIVVDRMDRWDVEWRNYRGGQNTALLILDLENASETHLPNESTVDIEPVWLGDTIYFLSDRDWTSNIWSYDPASGDLDQLTAFEGSDVKQLAGSNKLLAFERGGYLHTLDPGSGETRQLQIEVSGDFPWAESRWEDVGEKAGSASLSPTGKRAIMESRGEIFTIPVEHGNPRNITRSSGVADRAPLWSPKGDRIAWFSDEGGEGYALLVSSQDGLSDTRKYAIGESKMAWEPAWSPDGQSIAFTDDDVRIRVIDLDSGKITTADIGGNNIERGDSGLTWSPDSNWLAYTRTGSNGFKRIFAWSRSANEAKPLTNAFADTYSPAWDRSGKHLYFLASTDVALGSGWANTSAITADPVYGAYVINLGKEAESPFRPRSDEEGEDKESNGKNEEKDGDKDEESGDEKAIEPVLIDFEGIERRILALPIPDRKYSVTVSGPAGTVLIGEKAPNDDFMTIHKFSLEDREAKQYADKVNSFTVSSDGKKMLAKTGEGWQVFDTGKAKGEDGKKLDMTLKMELDRLAEWRQIFEEAWRYQRDYFYDPDMHGRDWDEVYRRYAPLVPHIRHRSDLSYVLDQMNGELSVGHSFVFGGDFPETDKPGTGLLGADYLAEKGRWKINRIYTSESWNPKLAGPLDQPGLNIREGHYLVGVNGRELSAKDNLHAFLEGTAGQQTILHINDKPEFAGAWQETVKPIDKDNSLRQRTWVEDNRRRVDELSDGKLAYVWVPNTGNPGLESFNRYFFGQQDKQGAVIDERFNGGGLLDDYMVDLMTRSLRASITNEVPGGRPFRLPAGILGPKVLLINELAGSGGDFFPWVFRQQKAGPLIGSRTWGGLVKSSLHYRFIDGGGMTAPDNAVFDPVNNRWIGENEGIAPDIEVYQDARSLNAGGDPQLERGVAEALRLLEEQEQVSGEPPPFSTPAVKK